MGNSSRHPDIGHNLCDNGEDKSLQFEVVYFSFSFVCFMISTCLFLSINYQTHNNEDEYPTNLMESWILWLLGQTFS